MTTLITVTTATHDDNVHVVASDGTIMLSGSTYQFDISDGKDMVFQQVIVPVAASYAPDMTTSTPTVQE